MAGENPKTSAVNRSVKELLLLTRRTQRSNCVIVLMLRRLSEHLCRINKSQSTIKRKTELLFGVFLFTNVHAKKQTPKMVSHE